MSARRRAREVTFWALLALAGMPAWGAEVDLTELSLEQLLNIEITTPSRFPQKQREAPASVTVITAQDIRAYGHRTLADVLRAMPGIHMSSDRVYSYAGVRGFSRPGDYNSRILLLVDGYRLNDNIYDQAYLGTDFILDLELVERVEFVPGPGSVIYGSNAFFGVVNVITRRGEDLAGPRAVLELAGDHDTRVGGSWGGQLENGADLLLSVSRRRTDGGDLHFPEFDDPATNHGWAEGLDGSRAERAFGRYSQGGLTVEGGYVRRIKDIPTASFDVLFNDPASEALDEQGMFALEYRGMAAAGTELTGRLFAGQARYRGDYPYASALNRDEALGRWWGGELRAMVSRYAGHELVLGIDYQHNTEQEQRNFDVAPYESYLDDRRSSSRVGVYLQDSIRLSEALMLHAGLRHSRYSTFGSTTNPRLGLVYALNADTVLKLLYGTAFRAPNVMEMYYGCSDFLMAANPDLEPERIATHELALNHRLGGGMSASASLFQYRVTDLIQQVVDTEGNLIYRNVGEAEAHGVELGTEKAWENGLRARVSLSLQRAVDALDRELTNAPERLAKLNLSAPLGGMRLGLEVQYVGERRSNTGTADAYTLANLTLSGWRPAPRLEVAASLYNLFDAEYADPVGDDHRQDVIPQEGRSYRLRLDYRF